MTAEAIIPMTILNRRGNLRFKTGAPQLGHIISRLNNNFVQFPHFIVPIQQELCRVTPIRLAKATDTKTDTKRVKKSIGG
jgi:hypothetical protein